MSETFSAIKHSWRELRERWALADDLARLDVKLWLFGWLLMLFAVVWSFGWAGAVFMVGLLITNVQEHAFSKNRD